MARELSAAALDRLMARPWLSVGGTVLLALVVAYAILIQQELLLVVWLLLAAFFVHLALRFVRAVERIAAAIERLVDGPG